MIISTAGCDPRTTCKKAMVGFSCRKAVACLLLSVTPCSYDSCSSKSELVVPLKTVQDPVSCTSVQRQHFACGPPPARYRGEAERPHKASRTYGLAVSIARACPGVRGQTRPRGPPCLLRKGLSSTREVSELSRCVVRICTTPALLCGQRDVRERLGDHTRPQECARGSPRLHRKGLSSS